MRNSLFIIITLFIVNGFAQDKKGCESSEPEYMNRMPGFYISDCKNSDYHDAKFIYYVKGKAYTISKGGKYYNISYTKQDGVADKFSEAQIIQNYYNAILKVKGTALADKKTTLTASINGKEVYIQLHTATNSTDTKSYRIEIVEVQPMEQEIIIDLQESIDKEGKAAIYGILFDIGKSDIKPESAPALQQIIDYLNAHQTVNIIVVGHTDNTGTYAGNLTLSKARAESIKNYLVNTGKIAASRLLSEGVGQSCPISTNDTEAGRKLNRRVEIVKL